MSTFSSSPLATTDSDVQPIDAPFAEISFAQVLIQLDARALDQRTFTYRIPDALQKQVTVGTPVVVSFGRIRRVTGLVVGLTAEPGGNFTPKPLLEVLQETPLFDAAYFEFLRDVAEYYATPLSQVLTCAMPGSLLRSLRRQLPQAKPSTETWITWLSNDAETARQRAVLRALHEKTRAGTTPIAMTSFLEAAKTTTATLHKLAALGCVQLTTTARHRDPTAVYLNTRMQDALPLTPDQHTAVQAVLDAKPGETFVLHGVTGSGKTEVYLALAEKILAQGKSVLLLVPEIALTSQIARRVMERFGRENVALWHSQLTDAERRDTWQRIRSGELRLVIGARSAIFTPLFELGLVILDEAHDDSFKQDTPAPRYDARTLSDFLAKRTGAPVLLGSATPDIAHYAQALSGQRRLLRLPKRFGGELPRVSVINMSKERRERLSGSLSRPLKEALVQTVARGHQAILLINRRGFHTHLACAECQYVFQCPQCAVGLTLHREARQVRCHYCGHQGAAPQFCPQCASFNLLQRGTGSQRVEEEVCAILPDARILRLDSDATQTRHSHRNILDTFKDGRADILVGTQMVAKGLDIPNVTLVGVVGADSTFFLPDFKSAERGFQLLTQVAGRAGRGETPGHVLFQAYEPDHPIIQLSQKQDYEGFYRYEIQNRERSVFPPFTQLIRFIVSGEDAFAVTQFAQAATAHLKNALAAAQLADALTVVGPAPCLIGRIQNRYRTHFLVKNPLGAPGHSVVTRFFREVTPPAELRFLIDVDAQSLL